MYSASVWTRLVYSLTILTSMLVPSYTLLSAYFAMTRGHALGLALVGLLMIPALGVGYRMVTVIFRPGTLDYPDVTGVPSWVRMLGLIGMHLGLLAFALRVAAKPLMQALHLGPHNGVAFSLAFAVIIGVGGMLGGASFLGYELGRLLSFEKAVRRP
jgi:phosphate/sulfate permease